MHTSAETPGQTSSLISAHSTCEHIQIRFQPIKTAENETSGHRFPFRLLVTPTSLPLTAKATPVGSPFQVLALTRGVRRVRVSSRRKPVPSNFSASHVHSPGRGSLAATSAPNSRTLERETTLGPEHAGFQPPTLIYTDVRYSVFSTAVQTNEIPNFSHHCQQVWGALESPLWILPSAGSIPRRPVRHLWNTE